MEESNKKVITMSFVGVALLLWFVVAVLLETFAATFGVVARAMDVQIIRHGFPVILAALVFVLLQFNKKVLAWADEVAVEIKKVVWPSKKDTTAMTIVVCVMVVISGITLGVFDLFTGYLVNLIIR